MGWSKRNPNIPACTSPDVYCRTCKRPASESDQAFFKGRPYGICYECIKLAAKNRYWQRKQQKLVFNPTQANYAVNFHALQALKVGIYALRNLTTSAEAHNCLLAVQGETYYLEVWGKRYRLFPDLLGIAAFIANFNLVVTTIPLALVSPSGEPIPVAELGVNLPIQEVAECYPAWADKIVKARDKARSIPRGERSTPKVFPPTGKRKRSKAADEQAARNAAAANGDIGSMPNE